MPLEPLHLDDLTWQSMTGAIRHRIAAASAGQWTLHAPVDPGVTLLELYAWMLEQRLYWLDQVPDSLTLAALNLLGEQPLPARMAGSVFQIKRTDPTDPQWLPPGVPFRLDKPGSEVVFTTLHSLLLLDAQQIKLFDGTREVTTDLNQGRTPEVFRDGFETHITLVLGNTPAVGTRRRAALLIELETSDSIAPQWSPEAVRGVAAPAEIEWRYESISGPARFPVGALRDGTAGLRRSGLVRFTLPADWDSSKAALHLRIAERTFSAPPRIRAIIPNVTMALHQRRVHAASIETLQWQPLPGKILNLAEALPGTDLLNVPVMTHTFRANFRERDGAWHLWKPVADFTSFGSADRVTRVDRETAVVRFGNGLTGRLPVPAPGGPNLNWRSRVGGGAKGNVGAGLRWREWRPAGTPGPRAIAANVVAGVGGREPETLEAARARTASLRTKVDRAVTQKDFETLALNTPGVAIARAHVAVGFHPDFPCTPFPGAVTVFVVPEVPRPVNAEAGALSASDEDDFTWVPAPVADPGALAAVEKQLAETRLLCSEVYVRTPCYRPVSLKIEIAAKQGSGPELLAGLKRVMRAFLDPLGGIANARERWPFGEPVRNSALVGEANRLLGTAGQVEELWTGLDGDVPHERCNDLPIGPHDLVYLDSLELSIRAATTPQGGLQ